MAKWNLSKLEKEAREVVMSKKEVFKMGLQDGCLEMEQFIRDNLYNTSDTQIALDKLIECQMWAERAAEQTGVK